LAIPALHTGAVTFCQRFGGALNLNPHYHVVCPDGVFVRDPDRPEALRFVGHLAPRNADLLAILDRIIRRIAKRLAAPANDDDSAEPEIDVGAQLQAHAITTSRHNDASQHAAAMRGAQGGRAWCDGFSLHAGVVIDSHDRAALERLCRYGARPAFAADRLAWTAEGKISYKLKRPWPDGRTHLVSEPVAFLRRLCGIIAPPRRHLVKYHGIFAPAAKDRTALAALLPKPVIDAEHADHAVGDGCAAKPTSMMRARRLPWADLLRRVFADDVLQCDCGGARIITAFVADGPAARAILDALDLASQPAGFTPARAPPQLDLDWPDPS